jgi:hypothetical protein
MEAVIKKTLGFSRQVCIRPMDFHHESVCKTMTPSVGRSVRAIECGSKLEPSRRPLDAPQDHIHIKESHPPRMRVRRLLEKKVQGRRLAVSSLYFFTQLVQQPSLSSAEEI